MRVRVEIEMDVASGIQAGGYKTIVEYLKDVLHPISRPSLISDVRSIVIAKRTYCNDIQKEEKNIV